MTEADRQLDLSMRLFAELKEQKRQLARFREPVAVVGMACRFPGGPDLAAFWRALEAGADAVTRGRPEPLPVDLETAETPAWGAYLAGLDRFDAEFFRIAPVEAELMDPQQRLLLEVSWEALEDAGFDPGGLGGSRTGVYAGIGSNDYQWLAGRAGPSLHLATGTSFATAVGRIAFTLGLQGPAMAVDTACSSSLTAIHQAVAGLQRGDADLALAGGVNAILNPATAEAFEASGMLAPDGRCKTFDAAADGYVRGEGCGMLVLKRLSAAERDGDRISGVILGSAVNQDGASAGLTVPNGPAQERVIREALERAGVSPAEVDYLEAHGTGTELGDPVEVQAAAAAYGEGRDPDRPLLLGSVKTNVGHLEAAAGVAGVVKVLLAMRKGVIPRHLHFERPNPRLDWERLPVRVTREAAPWPEDLRRPVRAGVSSFGFSGTNVHLIVEGYPEQAQASTEGLRPARLLPLSGRTGGALSALARRYREWLAESGRDWEALSDAAWTAGTGRSHFDWRAGVVFRDAAELAEGLELAARGGGVPAGLSGKTAFLFTGQGSQWAGMGRELHEREPVFREVLDRCAAVFGEEAEGALLPVMFGDAEGLNRTEWTQPALYALQSGLAALWASVGVRPDAVFGHSVGELAAAYAAGACGLEEGMRFAMRRGALMGSLPAGGGMAALFAPEEAVRAELEKTNARVRGAGLSLAAENGTHCVVSGPLRLVRSLAQRLGERGVRTERLRTSHAFHSALMDPVLPALGEAAPAGAGELAIPLVSGVTGSAVRTREALDSEYWVRQARSPVRFGRAVETLAELGVGALLEVGPRPVLGPLAALAWPESEETAPAVLSSLKPGPDGGFARAAGSAYEAGLPVSFAGLFAGERRRRVALPTYPFQRNRHWVSAPPPGHGQGRPLLGTRQGLGGGEVVFETALSVSNPGWLTDHRVFGRPVAPAAFFAAQALAAVPELGAGSETGAVEEVRIARPLALPEGDSEEAAGVAGRTVQLVLGRRQAAGARGFEVFSRAEDEEAWALHAAGRTGRGGAPAPDLEDGEIERLKDALSPIGAAALYRAFADAGIAYGPAFRGVRELWLGDGEALGEVALPEGLDRSGIPWHPAWLDACLQVGAGVFARDGAGDGETVWLPVGWESLWFRGAPPERTFCHARRSPGSGDHPPPGTRNVDLALYAADGTAVGGVRGFTLRRADRAALLAAGGVEELLYRVEWREAGTGGLRPAAFLAAPAEAEVRDFDAFLAAEGVDGTRLAGLTAGLDDLARSYAREAVAREPGPVEEHRRLFARVTELAAGAEPRRSPAALAAALEEQYPEGRAELGLLRRCGEALPEVLRGRADGLELLFAGTPNAVDLYRESPGYRAVNALAAEAVASVVSGLPEGRRLRVLEVGAGTGGTTAAIRAALPEGRADYVFTDISAGFFGEAEERFGGSDAGMSYRALDIERDVEEQGFAVHRHDLVVAANVLHATRDLEESLAHCRKLLAPSGVLVLVEGMEPRAWLDLTFGMLPGWWRFEDALRTDAALVGPEVWARALERAGYGEIALAGKGLGQAVILARGPAEVEPAPGLFVLAEGDAFGDELAEELRRRRQTVVRGPAGGDREAWGSFLASLPAEPPLSGIAHLGALSGGGEPMDDVRGTLSGALALTQGLLDSGAAPEAGMWFVTRGGQVLDGERDGQLFGSALWGFGRTADRELADLPVRLLDLENETPVARLAEELLFPDREKEVAYGDGVRRVPRLVRLPPAAPATPRLRGDRSYLVTGGLGGIGLQVAGWLVDRGAGAVVLNGRRAPDPAAEERIAALRARGVEIHVQVADVADRAAVDRMLAEIADAELPPLGGVFHGAGALADAALPNQDRERFERVLSPKVLGAWNLHRASLDLDLDLFVLFSSLTGVLGNPGQANHAAANAFLDQLALWRQTRGLPGLAIQWGAWSGVGEAEEQRARIAERLSALGAGWLSPEQGLAALDRLVGGPEGSVAAAPVNWSVLAGSGGTPPMLEELAPRGREGGARDVDLRSRLREMPAADREAALLALVREETRAVLRLSSLPAPQAGFFELGMDSLMAVELRNRLNRALSEAGGATVLPSTGVLDYPSPAKLAQRLAARFGAAGVASLAPARRLPVRRGEERIAVVGMGCRFPGGADPAAFWRSLAAGADAVTRGRPEPLPVDPETAADPAWGAYVNGLDRFDADFFRIAPVEAELMDPQQRLLLEVSWEALEDAGLAPEGLAGSRTGVYAGISASDYRDLIGLDGRERTGDGAEGLYAATGISFSTAIGRVAFSLGLEEPAMAVDTACSSSLVAIHQAAAGLQRGEADLALAGGVNAILTARVTRLFEDAGMLAPDGRCKTFDAAADGYVRGEGCGMLVLKRLSDAERDGDRIWGVILGSAVNQDGASAGLTVPNGPAQERVIREALERAGVTPADVDYLEAHGTGTELGDPVEVQAAAAAYGEGRNADHPLLLGSVKTNVGHLESAAGVAGLIKVLLAMREGVIPRHLHFERPNPRLDWEQLPVRVTKEATRWPQNLDRPLRAGVSSFGFSGTNAHLIVERYGEPGEAAGAPLLIPIGAAAGNAGLQAGTRPEGPQRRTARWPDDAVTPPAVQRVRVRPPEARGAGLEAGVPCRYRVLPLSGKTPGALRALAGRYRDWLAESDRDWEALSDAAWTAGTGRSHFGWRVGVVFQDAADLREGLELVERDGGVAPPEEPAPPMPARRPEATDGEFARAVADAYEAGSEVSFAELFPGERRRRIALPTYPFQRERHWVAAPAGDPDDLFYGVAWREAERAVRPADFLVPPAAAAAETEGLEQRLAAEGADRGRLAQLSAGLETLSRSLAAAALAELGWEPRADEEVEELRRALGVAGQHRRLFRHLVRMAPAERDPPPEALAERLLAEYPEAAATVGLLRRCGPALPEVLRGRADGVDLLFSGSPNAADFYREAPAYGLLNRLAGEAAGKLAAALPEGRQLRVLEVGAGTGATTAAVLAALPEGRTDYVFTDISPGFFGEAEERFGGPDAGMSYRVLDIERSPREQGFDAHRHDLVVAANVLHATRDLGESLDHCRELLAPSGVLVLLEGTETFGFLDLTFGLLPGWWRFDDRYRTEGALVPPPVWRQALADAGYQAPEVLGDGGGAAVFLAQGPPEAEATPGLFVLAEGDAFGDDLAEELRRRRQTVVRGPAGGDREAWRSFLASLPAEPPLAGIAHLGALSGGGELMDDVRGALGGALALTQGLQDAGVAPAAGVWFLTRGAQAPGGEREGELSGSALWGFGRTADRELADLPVRMLDLEPGVEAPVGRLAEELLFPDRENEVLHRGGSRRVPRLVRLPAEAPAAPPRLRADRSYLVTGGFGGIGLQVAGWLADRGAGGVVLNGRRAPDPEAGDRIAALEARGVKVRVAVADVADRAAVEGMLEEVQASELPPLGGVFHGAGVLADAALPNQDRERFEQVLAPKVLGAWNLHRATLDLDLDLFVLFSSLTGVLGNPGQANHAAANAFLDQLARWRRERGLPGLAIQWGAWSGVGEAEEQRGRIAERLAATGVGWLTPDDGRRALDRLTRGDAGTAIVARVDWPAFRDAAGTPQPIVSELAPGGEPAAPGRDEAGEELALRLRAATGAAREALLRDFVREEVRALLRLAAPPPPDKGFFDLGMDSLTATELRNRLNRGLSRVLAGKDAVENTAVFDHPTADRLARRLAAQVEGRTAPEVAPPRPALRGADERIAIVGMAGRFPGADDLAAFWRRLASGASAVTRGRPGGLVVDEETAEAAPWGAYIADLDRFDAAFFGISAAEAELMEPQQRLLLETSWHALEDAGIAPGSLAGTRTGVYGAVGNGNREYAMLVARSESAAAGLAGMTGSDASTAIGRIAYALGLEGPAVSVDTACSSSLVAIRDAVLGLQCGDTDLALAGGANAALSTAGARLMEGAGLLSPGGRCRAFDAAADGYVRGEGCGMVVLKRLADAEAAGDRVLAVIRGSAVNQDGVRAGLTAPNGSGQQRVIEAALERAGVEPAEVDYLEAHGIGSPLGDPIEVRAAAAAYGRGRPADRPLLLGSVKTNIGHLEAAAGAAAVVKAVLALGADTIPGQLHCDDPNPQIAWDETPVRVVSAPTPWPEGRNRPRRAAVSAFGWSGTNAHLVLEAYAAPEAGTSASAATRGRWLLPLSGQSPAALKALAGRYLDVLEETAAPNGAALADLAWTAGVGRSHLSHRAGVVFRDLADLCARLRALPATVRDRPARRPAKTCFVCASEPWKGMGTALYRTEPVARAVLDRCEDVIRELRGQSLLEVMFDGGAAGPEAPEWAEPALYALAAAVGALWSSLDVRAEAVFGAGAHEIAAAHLAGVFALEDGMRLSALRAAGGADAGAVRLQPPAAVLVSGRTGRPLGAEEVLDPAFWSGAAREEAPLAAGVATIASLAPSVCIGIGPEPLDGLAFPAPEGRSPDRPAVLSSQRGPGEASGAESDNGFLDAVAAAYEAGLDLHFDALTAGETRRRVSLPLYPFQRRRHWVTPRRRRRAAVRHPLLGTRRASARGEVTFETELYRSEPGWLKDHRRCGAAAAPGALFAAQAACAALREAAAGPAVVDDLRILEPLVLPERPAGDEGPEPGRLVQVVLGPPDGGGGRSLGVFGDGGEAGGGWVAHAEGTVRTGVELPPAAEALETPALAGAKATEAAAFYDRIAASGTHYGWSFRCLSGIRSGGGEASAEVRLRSAMDPGGIEAHPVLLEGCFQLAAAAVDDAASLLVTGWERFWLREALPARIRCQIRLGFPDNAPEMGRGDLALFTLSGRELGGVRGLRVARSGEFRPWSGPHGS